MKLIELKKNQGLESRTRLQLPVGLSTLDSKDIVLQKSQNGKTV